MKKEYTTGESWNSAAIAGLVMASLTIAADFTARSMEITLEDPDHAIYAVQFERVIPWLIHRLEA